jgi:hypothetical protein
MHAGSTAAQPSSKAWERVDIQSVKVCFQRLNLMTQDCTNTPGGRGPTALRSSLAMLLQQFGLQLSVNLGWCAPTQG